MIAIPLIAIAFVGGIVLFLLTRNRPAPDDIATFRRQIDALSPEARRRTTERMKPSEQSANDDDSGDDA